MTKIASVAAVVIVLALGLRVAARHDGPHVGPDGEVFTVGKNGDVKIGMDIAIGDVLVRKGKYVVEHRVDGSEHVLLLTGVDPKKGSETPVHQIRMRLLPARDVARRSALFAERLQDRSYRVNIVQIAGEAGDHVPRL